MTALNFPSSPTDGQTYTLNGVYYIYDANSNVWLTTVIPKPLDIGQSTDKQIIFNNLGTPDGASGATYDTVSNTILLNNAIVNNNVTATYFVGNGALLTGIVTSNNQAGVMANAANSWANTKDVYISNSAPLSTYAGKLWWNKNLGRLLVYYSDEDSAQWVDATPSYDPTPIFDVANGGFASANVVGILANAAFNTTNASFNTTNAAFQRANNSVYKGYFNSTLYNALSIPGDLMGTNIYLGETATSDAFGVSLVDVYDFMDPKSSLQTIDIGQSGSI